MSTADNTSPTEDIDQARKLFERHLLVKGLAFMWDGKQIGRAHV